MQRVCQCVDTGARRLMAEYNNELAHLPGDEKQLCGDQRNRKSARDHVWR